MTVGEIRIACKEAARRWQLCTSADQLAYEVDAIEELLVELDRLDDGERTHDLWCQLNDLQGSIRLQLSRQRRVVS